MDAEKTQVKAEEHVREEKDAPKPKKEDIREKLTKYGHYDKLQG